MSTPQNCYRCGQPGHFAASCTGSRQATRGSGGPRVGAVGGSSAQGNGGKDDLQLPNTTPLHPSIGAAYATAYATPTAAASVAVTRRDDALPVHPPRGGAGGPQQDDASHVTDVDGDLMTSTDSLCHCVSECLAMGKGIAVLFKNQFQGVDELKAQGVKVGGVAVLDRTQEADRRFIYYLVTKPRYFHKPTYPSLASSLAAMFQHMAAHGVTRVAMPEIGCGLDMLEWHKVRDMLETMLRGSNIHATVYHYKQPQQPQQQRRR